MYADDTLLVGVHGEEIQAYMESVVLIGAEYGLQLNWSKLEVLECRMVANIESPSGGIIQPKTSMVYFGSLLAGDGKIMGEINRRLGMAKEDFEVLQTIRQHTNLTKARKLRIFEAYIISKLTYGLVTAVLNKNERRLIIPNHHFHTLFAIFLRNHQHQLYQMAL